MQRCTDEQLIRLSRNSWFAQLHEPERCALLARASMVQRHAGHNVFMLGDAPNGFYGLVEGVLKAFTLRSDGREALLVVLEAGDWFGESAMFDGRPRTHTVTALCPVRLLRVDQQGFDELTRNATFAHAVAVLQAMHVRSVYAMLEDATLHGVRARIARRLQRMARGDATTGDATFGHAAEDVIEVTQDAMAMMLGITRQTLALELRAMAAEGAISLGYKRIRINSTSKLKAMEAPGTKLQSVARPRR